MALKLKNIQLDVPRHLSKIISNLVVNYKEKYLHSEAAHDLPDKDQKMTFI